MKNIKKIITILVCLCLLFSLTGCTGGGSSTEATTEAAQDEAVKEITVAYQYGLCYVPLLMMKEKGFLEDAYKEATGKELKVNWQSLDSGAAINEAIEAGTVQVGAIGPPPAICGIEAGMPYKIFSSIASTPITIQTNDKKIKTLKDIVDSGEKVATLSTNCIQRIVLAMACEKALGDAYAIPDTSIESAKHTDGKAGLESGTYKLHLTSPPFSWQEQDTGYNEVAAKEMKEAWPVGSSIIVGVISKDVYENDPDLYQAVCDAVEQSIDYVNENHRETADILSVDQGVTPEVYLSWLESEDCVFSTECKTVGTLAKFMAKNGFVKSEYKFEDITFDNVVGE